MRLLITLSFLTLFAFFAFGPAGELGLASSRAEIDPRDIDRAATRAVLGDPPRIDIAGNAMSCQECHGIFESKPETERVLNQHQEIVLSHGMNDRCFNCHHNEDRNSLVLAGNKPLAYSESEKLCASCHGPTFRDWTKGIHGKTLGSWDPASPDHRRLRCTECHDPHRPAFQPIAPLPAPRTLRMKATSPEAKEHHGKRNPLRIHRDNSESSPLSEQH